MEFDNLKDELLSIVDTGLKHARVIDSEAEFELYVFYRNKAEVDITQGVVKATEGIIAGNAVRAAKQKSVSFASSSGITSRRIERSINEAIASLSSLRVKDEQFRGFCRPGKPGKEGAFASQILNLEKDELIDNASILIKDGQGFDKRIKTVESECSMEWGGFAVGNNQGLLEASRSASNTCGVSCIAIQKGERRSAYEYDISRERLFNTEGMGEKAARKAINLLNAKKLNKTTVLPTIWEPIAAAAYILISLGQSASGDNVVEGRSPIADRIGHEIASSKLTILDDGQNPASISTESIDAEGHPQQTNLIVEDGKLAQFLFNTYYARIYGTKSTGNCARGGGPFGSTLPYETAPLIRPKSIEVKPGRKDVDDIIASVDGEAILITDFPIGIFNSTVSTGEFSSVAQSAYLIRNGERKHSLQPLSVSGSFYRGLKEMLEVGSDLERTPFNVETPSLLIDGFSIVG